ncbi:hypothetical protein BHE74_00008269 [Ensete ventricosum]|nr:hypothetical protein BHE74_00008269 [Ensete ventricosum]
MAVAPKISLSVLPSRSSRGISLPRPSCISVYPPKFFSPMASLSVARPPGISETFSCLKEQGKVSSRDSTPPLISFLFRSVVAFIPFITAGDPDLSTTSKALKVLDSSGSDLIELGIPYSDPLADGPVIQVLLSVYFIYMVVGYGVVNLMYFRLLLHVL